MKNVLVGQSGGPTAVINSSLAGVYETAKACGAPHVYGMQYGIEGVLEGKLIDLDTVLGDKMDIELLKRTPSSFLGSCRHKLPDPTVDEKPFVQLFELFRQNDIGAVFYIGGNDSMDTISKLSAYGKTVNSEIRFIGVPKTIDNDLDGTDHCPGYASAAKYIATSCMELYQDARVYDTGTVVIVEIMGRHAGWLAGAAGLASWAGSGPDLVYLPEVDFDMDQFLADVKRIYDATGNCLVAVSEGIHYADGTFVSEAKTSATDGFGHAQLGGLAAMLADVVKQKMGVKVRGIELSLLQRCGSHLASRTDIQEAYAAGKAAVEAAVAGLTDQMVALDCTRDADGYHCQTKLIPLTQAANTERKVPRTWINEAGNGVCQSFIDYALPLIQGEPARPLENGLPKFARLKKVLTTSID